MNTDNTRSVESTRTGDKRHPELSRKERRAIAKSQGTPFQPIEFHSACYSPNGSTVIHTGRFISWGSGNGNPFFDSEAKRLAFRQD